MSNIGSNVSEKKILEEFKYYGEVVDFSIKRKNGKSNYFGYILMKSRTAAEKAMKEISKELDWKITLYEKDERRERHKSKSSSRSRSLQKEKKETPQEEEVKPEQARSVKVREIWVGNLPNSINEQSLYNQFFIFGEIAKMDCHFQSDKNYAFIRYRLSASASRAYEKAKNMKININGNILRVSFSDSGKRREIIGDEEGYEVNEKNCKLLHISLNIGSNPANEQNIREIFSKYGSIKGLHIKNISGYRPTIYLEFSKPEEAENALHHMTTLDINNEKKALLGDPLCDINFDFKKKLNFKAQANGIDAKNNVPTSNGPMNNMMMNPSMMNPQMMLMYQNCMMQQMMNPQYSNYN